MAQNDDPECYPNSGVDVQVLRFAFSPLTYTIFPRFEGIANILHELSIPVGIGHVYNLIFVGVRDFLKYSGRYYHKIPERYRRYTVETFGLRIKLPPNFKLGMNVPLPDSSQYKCQPGYYTFSGIVTVQVWRWRVLSCSVEELKTSTRNPFGNAPLGTMYFEERWHPYAGNQRFAGLIGKASFAQFKRLGRFEEDALRVLDGTFKLGRPRGSKKLTLTEFQDKLRSAYAELHKETKQHPKQFALAERLEIDLSTFKRYMRELGNPKPPY
jgi:hypothetical protein